MAAILFWPQYDNYNLQIYPIHFVTMLLLVTEVTNIVPHMYIMSAPKVGHSHDVHKVIKLFYALAPCNTKCLHAGK